MRKVFADAGYWVALLNPADSLHEKARSLSPVLNGARVFTTDAVLVEVMAFLGSKGSALRGAAVRLVKVVKTDPNVTLHPVTRDLFDAGFADFEKFNDKGFSHTDCVSFIVMREHSIADALAYDHHFIQAGFNALLR